MNGRPYGAALQSAGIGGSLVSSSSTSSSSFVTPFAPEETLTSCINAGDTAWMLIATVLVLGMFPGVAFFELGLLRKKNTTSIIAQIFCGLPVLSTMWFMFGYSLTFGPDISGVGLLGNLEYLFLAKVSFEHCRGSEKIPSALYAIYQMMFACITPLLMTGAYAERLAWKPFLSLTIFWEIVVYYPVAHWIWHPHGWLAQFGVQDFAGGIVIHTTAGVASIVACIMLGRRHHYEKYNGMFPYSSLPFACVGATLLWTGWMGFNGGSALGANPVALHAVMNSQIAASVCATVLLGFTYYHSGKPSTIVMLNGAVAGLAGITPASGFITPLSAFILAILLALATEGGAKLLKGKFKVDDALEVGVVHGLTGLVGSLFIGFAGSSEVNPAGANGVVYTEGKDWSLLGIQLVGVLVAGTWAGIWTFVILKVTSLFTPLRVSHHHEVKGLDAAIHYETASVAYSAHGPPGPNEQPRMSPQPQGASLREHGLPPGSTLNAEISSQPASLRGSIAGAEIYPKHRQHSVKFDRYGELGMERKNTTQSHKSNLATPLMASGRNGTNFSSIRDEFPASSSESDDEAVTGDIRPSESAAFMMDFEGRGGPVGFSNSHDLSSLQWEGQASTGVGKHRMTRSPSTSFVGLRSGVTPPTMSLQSPSTLSPQQQALHHSGSQPSRLSHSQSLDGFVASQDAEFVESRARHQPSPLDEGTAAPPGDSNHLDIDSGDSDSQSPPRPSILGVIGGREAGASTPPYHSPQSRKVDGEE